MSVAIPDGVNWVWLDLDNTLWDFTNNSVAALGEIYEIFRLNRWWATPEAWRQIYESHNNVLWEQYARQEIDTAFLRRQRFLRPLREVGAEVDDLEAWADHLDDEYLRRLSGRPGTMPGAEQLLLRLRRRGLRLGILSNGFADVQGRKLRSSGLDKYIHRVIVSEEARAPKPAPEIYRYAMAQTGAAPSQCLMIGDNPDTDIRGALLAGWQAVFYNPCAAEVPAGARSVASLAEIV